MLKTLKFIGIAVVLLVVAVVLFGCFAPVFGGQPYGILKILSDGEVVDERQLLASKDIGVASFFSRIWDLLILFFKGLLNISSA